MIETVMRTHLLNAAAVAALVGTRVYPTTLPQSPTLPAVTYQQIAERNVYSGAGHSGLVGPLIQVDAWAKTFLEAGELGDALKDAMHKLTGLALGKNVQGVFCTRRATFFEDDTKVHRISADYFLWYGD